MLVKFRVQAEQHDADLQERLEAEGLKWQPSLGCYLLEIKAESLEDALVDAEKFAERLSQRMSDLQVRTPHATPDGGTQPEAGWNLDIVQLSDDQRSILQRFEQCLVMQAYSPKTQRIYKNAFRNFVDGISPRLPLEVKKEEVEKWIAQRMNQRNGSNSLYNTLINAVKFYYVTVEGRPSGGWVFQRPKAEASEPQTLTRVEVQALMSHTTNAKHRCLLLLTYSTGLRLNEVLNLRRKDLNFSRMTINIHRDQASGHGSRAVPLSPKLAEALSAYFQEFNPRLWLFEGERPGDRYSERSAQMAVKHAAKRAGLPQAVSMHMLRNSFATHQLEAGIAMAAVQDLMGHSSIRSTGRYAHVARHKMPASPADLMDL